MKLGTGARAGLTLRQKLCQRLSDVSSVRLLLCRAEAVCLPATLLQLSGGLLTLLWLQSMLKATHSCQCFYQYLHSFIAHVWGYSLTWQRMVIRCARRTNAS